MKHIFPPIIICMVVFFATTFSSEAYILKDANLKSICDVTMSHDVLVPKFMFNKQKEYNAGDNIALNLELFNKTSSIFKNSHILYKVYYYDKESLAVDTAKPEGRLVDIFLSKESHDVAPGSSKSFTFNWQSEKSMPNGLYRVEAHTVQNKIHVINDFARPTSYTNTNFTLVNGNEEESKITIKKEKSYFVDSNDPYPILKLRGLTPEELDMTLTVVVRNDGNKDADVNYSWRVNPYGKFDDTLSLTATSGVRKIKAKSEAKITLPVPNEPANRYHAIFNIESDGQKSTEVFRWLRVVKVPSLIDTYGIVKNGEFIATATGTESFTLKKGEKYVAFACLIGGYAETPTNLSMRIKDGEGKVFFSKEESRGVTTTISAFEYEFIPTKDINKYELEIMTDASGMIEKATWANDCNVNKSAGCVSVFEQYYKYAIGILIIGLLFGLYYFIRNKSTYKNQNDEK